MSPITKYLPYKSDSEKRRDELLSVALDCFAVAIGGAVLAILYVVL